MGDSDGKSNRASADGSPTIKMKQTQTLAQPTESSPADTLEPDDQISAPHRTSGEEDETRQPSQDCNIPADGVHNTTQEVASVPVPIQQESSPVINATREAVSANFTSSQRPFRQSDQEIVRMAQSILRSYGYQFEIKPATSTREPEEEHLDSVSSPEAVFRTVIQETGGPLTPQKSFSSLSQEEYASIQDETSGTAFEIQKRIRTIPPPPNSSRAASYRGNKLIGGAIVDRVLSEKIIIRSPSLLRDIRTTVFWPSSAYQAGRRELEINVPYRSISVYRTQFDTLLETYNVRLQSLSASDAQGVKDMDEKANLGKSILHLQLLLEEVDRVQAGNVKLEEARFARNMVTFDMLWMRLTPGTYIYASINDTIVAGRVNLLIWDSEHGSQEDGYSSVTVHLWYLDHDGPQVLSLYQTIRVF
jgi:hypothetical protein